MADRPHEEVDSSCRLPVKPSIEHSLKVAFRCWMIETLAVLRTSCGLLRVFV